MINPAEFMCATGGISTCLGLLLLRPDVLAIVLLLGGILLIIEATELHELNKS